MFEKIRNYEKIGNHLLVWTGCSDDRGMSSEMCKFPTGSECPGDIALHQECFAAFALI